MVIVKKNSQKYNKKILIKEINSYQNFIIIKICWKFLFDKYKS